MNSYQLENGSDIITNVHSSEKCDGEYCTIHNRSDHHMRGWPQHWRSDRGIMERICPHGVGHPDPDNPWPDNHSNWIHGCDGCCAEPKAFEDVGSVQFRRDGDAYSDSCKIYRCLECFCLTINPKEHLKTHDKKHS